MAKIIRLTERDLTRLVKRVIKEDLDTYEKNMTKPWRRLAGINPENPGHIEDYDISDQELSDISNTLDSIENEINNDSELMDKQKNRLLDHLAFVKDYLDKRKTHGKDFQDHI
jgi:hypothetical protein